MASLIEWKVPQASQPRAEDYPYDLERALSSVVGLHSIVPSDAFTADTLGVERAGNGVLIDDGVVLTIGYLITEAETVWLHLSDGRVVQGHPLGFDQETGFGLVQALGKIDFPSLEIGSSKRLKSASASSSAAPAAEPGRSLGASRRNRNSPGIGNTSSTKRFSPIPLTRTGAAPR
jgi:S1-C subfamily serine protease